jgi:hypothetical protein
MQKLSQAFLDKSFSIYFKFFYRVFLTDFPRYSPSVLSTGSVIRPQELLQELIWLGDKCLYHSRQKTSHEHL